MVKPFINPILRRRRRTTSKKKDSSYSGYSQNYGGLINPITGVGTSLDKNSQSFYIPTRLISKNDHETIYIQSWAAAKFIDIPVDDMFVRWREFTDMDSANVKIIEKAEKEFKIKSKLSKSMKSGRLYGTGLFVILTKEATPDKPLNIDRMMPGDLSNIITVDRFDATVVEKENNPFSLNYGLPLLYRITLKYGGSFIAHHSRVIRFDGKSPMTDNSWQAYDQDWGIASIVPVLTEIFQDSNISKGVAHLVNEASVPVQKISDFEDAISGSGDEDSMSLQDRMEQITMLRSIYRTVFMDSEDSLERVAVSFAGLPDLLDRSATRLSAAADIPETRFWSKSIVGMQSTGEGEQRNYALKVASDQENKLPEPLDKIDSVLEKHTGLSEKIKYKFVSIMDISEKDKTEVALKKVQIVAPLVNLGLIDEDEGRAILDGDEIIGNLDDLDETLPGIDTFKRNLANKQIERQQQEGFANKGELKK